MKIERDRTGGGPIVAALGPAGFRIDEAHYRAVLLTTERAIDWAPPPLDSLDVTAFEAILSPAPEFVLLGTGTTLVQPPRALVRALDDRGIGVEAMDSRAAARAWGVLRSEGRTIAAALYPLDR